MQTTESLPPLVLLAFRAWLSASGELLRALTARVPRRKNARRAFADRKEHDAYQHARAIEKARWLMHR